MRRYRDRDEAGRLLAADVARLGLADPVVLALPRGGLPVARPIAAALGAPLHVLVVRKIGAPGHSELGVGALAEDGVPVWDRDLLARLGLVPEDLDRTVAAERVELARRVAAYRGGAALPPLADRDAVIVDDGVATGGTTRAALVAVRAQGVRRLVLAAPVAPPDVVARLTRLADDVVIPLQPPHFSAVSAWYASFPQLTDAEVMAVLADAAR